MTYKAYQKQDLGFTTRQLHAGYNPLEHNRAKAVPIYQTAAFETGDFDRSVRLFEYSEDGHAYARYSNPTNEVLEKRLASLEGAESALTLASGMAAVCNTFLNLAGQGDEIIGVETLYGGNSALLREILPEYGIVGHLVEDPENIESFEALINDRTKAIFIESLGNPLMNILDFDAIAELCHRYGIAFVVDNTFATPYLFRPMEHGADIVIYSATKYLGGHGNVIGGVVLESGKFDWLNGRYPQFDAFYEQMKDKLGEEVIRKEMFNRRLRYRFLTDFGSHMPPISAFLLIQGIETLSLRMRAHVENAEKIADFLSKHEKVLEVNYPSVETSPWHERKEQYFEKGAGAILSLRLKGGLEAARKMIESLEVFDFLVNVGDSKSLVCHPATSTHVGQSEEELLKAGVYPDMLRISVGIEDSDDLIADLKQALDQL